jgi:bifunctional ADP-heptose synthase (sugar kinase/adenylyltransferase)
VIRIDRDDGYRLQPHHKREIIKRLKDLSDKVDAFIVSDYGHNTVDEEVIAFMQDIAKKRIVVGDSRYNLKRFKGFTMITPNESEAYALASMEDGTPVEE